MIDTHCHLYDEAFAQDFEEVIGRARSVGIQQLLLPNIDWMALVLRHAPVLVMVVMLSVPLFLAGIGLPALPVGLAAVTSFPSRCIGWVMGPHVLPLKAHHGDA